VDAIGDVGRYASLAIHPNTGLPYVVYIKATNDQIEDAHWTPGAGNCVPNTDWTCNDFDFIQNGHWLSFSFTASGGCLYAFQTADAKSNWLNSDGNCFGPGGFPGTSRLDSLSTGATGAFNSLKLAFDGTFQIAFQTVTNSSYLKYARPSTVPDNCNYSRCDIIDSGAAVDDITT